MKTFVLTSSICYVYAWRFWDFWVKTTWSDFQVWPPESSLTHRNHQDIYQTYTRPPPNPKKRSQTVKFDLQTLRMVVGQKKSKSCLLGSTTGGLFWGALLDFYHLESCLEPLYRCFCMLWNRLGFIFEDLCFTFSICYVYARRFWDFWVEVGLGQTSKSDPPNQVWPPETTKTYTKRVQDPPQPQKKEPNCQVRPTNT